MSAAQRLRFSVGDIGRFCLMHFAAAGLAGLAFTLARTAMAAPAFPGLGAVFLLWFLAAIQIAIFGAAAGMAGVVGAALLKRAHGAVFPAAGVVAALAIGLIVEQANATFLVPAAAAGFVYGLALFRLAWRPAMAAA
jgi:hypothetical protein